MAERLSGAGGSAVIRRNRPEDVVKSSQGDHGVLAYRAPLNVLQELSCAGGTGWPAWEVYTEAQSKKPGAMQGGLTNG